MASSPLLLSFSLLILFLRLFSFSAALPSHSILNAAEILSDSGYVSMALTLEVVSQSLVPKSPSLTIFAPPDSAFNRIGQPSLSLLQFHFAPLALPLQTLKSLPAGTKIPTLLSGHSLVVTAASSSATGSEISLNNVRVQIASPIFDDGFLIILGIDDFFDPNYQSPAPTPVSFPDPICGGTPSSNSTTPIGFPGSSWFDGARSAMQSNGYTVMASFLDLQLVGFKNPSALTVFAPVDQAMENPLQDPSLFLRHVVPCRLTWYELASFSEGTTLPTYVAGYTITISRYGDVLLLNGVPVYFANMYYDDSFVVHGLQESLEIPQEAAGTDTNEDYDELEL